MQTGPGRNRRDLLNLVLVAVLLGWFGFNWYSTVAHIVRYYNPLPVSDYWRVIEDLPDLEAGDFSWLWRQHNEHRIIFPEIVFALDQLIFAGRQVLPVVVSFCCYAATIVLLGHTFWRNANAPPRARAQGLVLGGIIAGWPLSTFVLGTPFLLPWTLLQFAVVLGIISVSRLSGLSGLRWLPVVIACSIVATFSSASGLLLWPVLLVLAALFRAPRSYVVALAVSATVSLGLFLVGYHRPSAPLLASLKHPIYCFGFAISYLGMPFGVLRNPVFGMIFGVLSLTTWLACFPRTSHSRTRFRRTYKAVAFGYLAFLLLTAALTSLGRVDMADIGFSNAKAARYVTLPLVGWAVLIPLALAVSCEEKWRRFTPQVIVMLTVVIVGFMQIRLGRWLRTNDDYMSHQQWAAVSLENGVFDPGLLGSVFPSQAFLERYVPVLRAYHKSIFADPAADFPGRSFRSIFPLGRKGIEPGGVARVAAVKGGVSVLGWAANLDRGGKITVVFVDSSGIIIGFGRHLRAGIPRELLPLPANPAQTWVGFINGRYGASSFVPYLAEPGSGSAWPIAQEIPIPATTVTGPPL